jgi:hypothetical protein
VCRVTIAAQGAMRDALERAIALRDLPYELDEGVRDGPHGV